MSVLLTLLGIVGTPAIHGQATDTSSSSSQYQIGSSLEATADPTVPRPNTRPCVVTLLSQQAFDNFNNQSFSYTPPANCPGPWSKVVFEGDFSIQAGVADEPTAFIASCDEFHQSFLPSRTGKFSDVVLDTIGATIVSGIVLTAVWKRRK